MNKADIIKFNERTAIEKIRAAYKANDVGEALRLVHICFGIDDAKPAYNKMCGICWDLMEGRE